MPNVAKTDKVLVIDVESTCWLGHPPEGMRNEVIEIGYAVVDTTIPDIIEGGSLYIKPANSVVSDFCTELTGITPQLLDKLGRPLAEVRRDLLKWQGMAWCSWGEYDQRILKENFKYAGLHYPLSPRHFNLKVVYSALRGVPKEMGCRNAVEHAGLTWVGDEHKGSDDAWNTAAVLKDIISAYSSKPLKSFTSQ
jgi:inhibitor of KinA sporulation pathway (predicted exonuclease)